MIVWQYLNFDFVMVRKSKHILCRIIIIPMEASGNLFLLLYKITTLSHHLRYDTGTGTSASCESTILAIVATSVYDRKPK